MPLPLLRIHRNLDFGSFVDGLPILELPELLGGLGCSLSGQKVQS
jgi:hypothetical protein